MGTKEEGGLVSEPDRGIAAFIVAPPRSIPAKGGYSATPQIRSKLPKPDFFYLKN
jgi:hypothetical protein